MSDQINPEHYKTHPEGSHAECIEYTRHMGFSQGNAFKYLYWAGSKGDPAADLAKAAWYVRDCIDHGSARMVMADRGFPRINPNVTHRAMALRLIAMGKVQEVARALDHFGSRVLDTREAATYEQEKTP